MRRSVIPDSRHGREASSSSEQHLAEGKRRVVNPITLMQKITQKGEEAAVPQELHPRRAIFATARASDASSA